MVSKAENRTTVRPYVQANGGMTNYLEGMQAKATAEIGARLTSGNLNAEVGAHIGTEAGAHANVGYRMPLNDKVGINFQGGASYTKSLAQNTTQSADFQYQYRQPLEQNGTTCNVEVNDNYGIATSYKPDLYKAGIGAALDIKPNDKFNISFGAEAGVRGNNAPKVHVQGKEYTHEVNINEKNVQGNILVQTKTPDVTLNYKKSKLYATPTISANYNINDHLTVGLKGNLNEAGAKVSWTF